MYICMYLCIHESMYECRQIYMSPCMHMYMHVYQVSNSVFLYVTFIVIPVQLCSLKV